MIISSKYVINMSIIWQVHTSFWSEWMSGGVEEWRSGGLEEGPFRSTHLDLETKVAFQHETRGSKSANNCEQSKKKK